MRKRVWAVAGAFLAGLVLVFWLSGRSTVQEPESRFEAGKPLQTKHKQKPKAQPHGADTADLRAKLAACAKARRGTAETKTVVTVADENATAAIPQGTAAANPAATWSFDSEAPRRYKKEDVIKYRERILPATEKGGAEGVLREWLVKDGDRTVHVEEEYRPNASDEMVYADGCAYVANHAVALLGADEDVDAFKAKMSATGISVEVGDLSFPTKTKTKKLRLATVSVPETDFDTAENLKLACKESGMCDTADFNSVYYLDKTPNDTSYSRLWGMTKIKAPQAWESITDASSKIVAVIDTGINANHEDLSANLWRKGLYYGTNSVEGTNYPIDENGHGSHVSGTIGAVGNNSKGVAGVAWNTKIMSVKIGGVGGSRGVDFTAAAFGIAYAVDNGARILNCSWGGNGSNSLLAYVFELLSEMDVIVVCAAGNNATNNEYTHNYPSDYPYDNIVSVAATTSSDTLASFSNYGAISVDIAAPGCEIFSTWIGGTSMYATIEGTSQAAPHVSGALALIWAKYPNLSALEVINKLYAAGDSLSSLSGKVKTGKRLNVYNAVQATASCTAPTGVTATRGAFSDKVIVSWNAVSGATHYRVSRATSSTGSKTDLGVWQVGTTYTNTSVSAGTTYYYWVRAATSSTGANVSAYSAYATGYSSAAQTGDTWDPGDDTAPGATSLSPAVTVQSHGPHTMSSSDRYDWFKATLTAGVSYTFESTGSSDMYGELFGSTSTNTSDRVSYNDDVGTNRNFRIVYTPSTTKTYYLRVRCFSVGSTGAYNLSYRRTYPDSFDPTDDTASGATALTPTTTVQTHSGHGLNDNDLYDFYKVSMTANRTYVFETTGTSDTYGELYSSASIDTSSRVAYNDDGGTNRNFKIAYTPTASGIYYLRVRGFTPGNSYSYSLQYSVTAQEMHNLTYFTLTGWPAPLFLSKIGGGTSATTSFTPNETVHVNYAYRDAENNAINVPITNTFNIVNLDTSVTNATFYHISNSLGAGHISCSTNMSIRLPSGRYRLYGHLNEARTVTETNYADNDRTIDFTVAAPAQTKTLTALTVSGLDTVGAGQNTTYSARATYNDGTSATVAANWSVTAGGAHASISSAGVLTARDVTENQTVTVAATYAENGVTRTGTKQVNIRAPAATVTPTPGTGGGSGSAGPWDSASYVSYPNPPMAIRAAVKLDGETAATGGQLAAFCGSELRGVANIRDGGRATLTVQVAAANEDITLRMYDAVSFETYQSSAIIKGNPGQSLGGDSPYEIDFFARDPFGEPVAYPNPPMTVRGTVTIYGVPASRGDVVGVFCGEELRGKYAVNVSGGEARVTLVVNIKENGERLTFKVWDADGGDTGSGVLLSAAGYVTGQSGGVLGDTARHPIAVSRERTLNISVRNSGWSQISVNVLPSDRSPAALFADAIGSIAQITGDGKTFNPAWGDDNTLTSLEPGIGYWVNARAAFSTEITGAPADVSATPVRLRSGWNNVGYVPQEAGRVADVLANLIRAGGLLQVTGEGRIYNPAWGDDNTLTAMRPGVAYWIQVSADRTFTFEEPAGTSAAAALADIQAQSASDDPFGEVGGGDTITPWTARATLSLFGHPVTIGEGVLAAFANGSSVPLWKGEANTLGRFIITVSKVPGTVLSFKYWDRENNQIYTVDSSCNQTLVSDGMGGVQSPGEVLAFTISGSKPTYTVNFNLGGKGTRTGGGALTQQVQYGAAATPPTVSANSGWQFLPNGWQAADGGSDTPDMIKRDVTFNASYVYVGSSPAGERVTVRFDAQGGVCSVASKTYEVKVDDDGNRCIEFDNLPVPRPSADQKGLIFGGWAISPDPLPSGFYNWVLYDGYAMTEWELGGFNNVRLYAIWDKGYKITVKEGTIYSPTSLKYTGAESTVTVIPGSFAIVTAHEKLGQYFSMWDVSPTGALGGFANFDPTEGGVQGICTPAQNVTLTAKYVKTPAAFTVVAASKTEGWTLDPGLIEYSIDKKVWFPANGSFAHIVAAGKVTIQFRSADITWDVAKSETFTINPGQTGVYRVYASKIVPPTFVAPSDAEYDEVYFFRETDRNGTYYEAELSVGVNYTIPLELVADEACAVSVKGLPAGLKFDAKTKTIAGLPTKPGRYDVEISATSSVKKSVVTKMRLNFKVLPMPNSLVGNYGGAFAGLGVLNITVGSTGKITGRWTTARGSYQLSGNGFSSIVAYETADDTFGINYQGVALADVTVTYNKMPIPVTVFFEFQELYSVSRDDKGNQMPIYIGKCELIDDSGLVPSGTFCRDATKDVSVKAALTGVAGTYHYELGGKDTFDVIVSKSGAIQLKGVRNGKSYSASVPFLTPQNPEMREDIDAYFSPFSVLSGTFSGYIYPWMSGHREIEWDLYEWR